MLVGLAFNTKTLAAYLVVPGIAVGYLVCAPGSIPRRLGQLAVAGLAMLVVSFAWIAFVELTPASKRPYVGSSTNNTELGLTFAYNGFGRVEGQAGGPGQVAVLPGAYVPAARQRAVNAAARAAAASPQRQPPRVLGSGRAASPRHTRADTAREPTPTLKPIASTGREKNPIPFGGPPARCGCSASGSAIRPGGCSRSRSSDCSAWRCWHCLEREARRGGLAGDAACSAGGSWWRPWC